MALGYAKSCLIGALLECIVYGEFTCFPNYVNEFPKALSFFNLLGLYFTVFSQTLLILRRKLIPGAVSIYLTATTFVLFFLITLVRIHWYRTTPATDLIFTEVGAG